MERVVNFYKMGLVGRSIDYVSAYFFSKSEVGKQLVLKTGPIFPLLGPAGVIIHRT